MLILMISRIFSVRATSYSLVFMWAYQIKLRWLKWTLQGQRCSVSVQPTFFWMT